MSTVSMCHTQLNFAKWNVCEEKVQNPVMPWFFFSKMYEEQMNIDI